MSGHIFKKKRRKRQVEIELHNPNDLEQKKKEYIIKNAYLAHSTQKLATFLKFQHKMF